MTAPVSSPAPAPVPIDQPLYGANPAQAIARFFRKYATFSGRASRAEFWWSHAVIYAIFLVLLTLGIVFGIQTGHPGYTSTGTPTFVPGVGLAPFAILMVLFYLAILVPSIAVTVRRLHDSNFSGLLYLLVFLGGIGGLAILVLCVLDPNPRGVQYDAGAQPVPYPAGTAAVPPVPAGSVAPSPPAPPAAP